MDTYPVTVRRDGTVWYLDLGEVGATQARHLREVDAMARDYIALVRDIDPDSFEIDVTIEIDDDVRAHLTAAAEAASIADDARGRAAAEHRAAARALHAKGLPMRDVGQVLGVSHQRAHQLVSGQ